MSTGILGTFRVQLVARNERLHAQSEFKSHVINIDILDATVLPLLVFVRRQVFLPVKDVGH